MDTTELKDFFRSEAMDVEEPQLWSDAEVYRYMDDAQKMFCRLTGGLSDASSSLTLLAVAAGVDWVSISPLILEIKSANDTVTGAPIEVVSPEQMAKRGFRFNGQIAAVKRLVTGLEAHKLRTHPIPDADSTIALVVDRLPLTNVTAGGQTLEIDEQHHQHLIKWMFHRAYSKRDAETFDRAESEKQKAAFEAYCAGAKLERERAKNKVRVVAYAAFEVLAPVRTRPYLLGGSTMIYTPEPLKITLAAGVPYVSGAQNLPININIPTGTTATVYTTMGTNAEVNADTCEWTAWPSGTAAGPVTDAITSKVSAFKIVSAAGGFAYIMRGYGMSAGVWKSQAGGASSSSAQDLRPPYKKDNFYKKRYTQIDNMSAAVGHATAAWTKFTGTCVLANSKDRVFSPLGCTNALKLTNLSNFERVQKNFPGGIVPSAGTLMVPVHISEMPVDYSPFPPTLPTYQTASLQVILSVDSGFLTTIATSLNLTSQQFLRAGWNACQWSTNDDGTLNTTGNPSWVYSGTAPGDANTSYKYMRVVLGGLQPLGSTTPVVTIGGVFQGGASTPMVLINVDDGHVDTIDIAAMAQQFGLRIASSVITGTVGQGAQMTWAQHKAMSDAGHDIIAHSRTHPIAGLDSLTPAQLANELLCGQDLITNGLGRVADVIAFPENATNDVINAATKAAGFTLARASKPGWTHTATGFDNGMMLGSRDVGGKTLAQVKKFLDSAQFYGCLQIIYFHRIFTVAAQSMTYSAGVVTVASTAHGYSNGNLVHHRGADQAEFNVAGIVENAGANVYTFKVTGTFTVSTATSAIAICGPIPRTIRQLAVRRLPTRCIGTARIFSRCSKKPQTDAMLARSPRFTYSPLLDRCMVNS